jgi:chloride channel, nucleotide-sensitive, 1A
MTPSGSKGFTVPYPNITLHAVSRTDTLMAVYCQIDPNPEGNTANTEPTDEEDVIDLIELTLIPSDSNSGETLPSYYLVV